MSVLGTFKLTCFIYTNGLINWSSLCSKEPSLVRVLYGCIFSDEIESPALVLNRSETIPDPKSALTDTQSNFKTHVLNSITSRP